jgi:hypothetical protein
MKIPRPPTAAEQRELEQLEEENKRLEEIVDTLQAALEEEEEDEAPLPLYREEKGEDEEGCDTVSPSLLAPADSSYVACPRTHPHLSVLPAV